MNVKGIDSALISFIVSDNHSLAPLTWQELLSNLDSSDFKLAHLVSKSAWEVISINCNNPNVSVDFASLSSSIVELIEEKVSREYYIDREKIRQSLLSIKLAILFIELDIKNLPSLKTQLFQLGVSLFIGGTSSRGLQDTAVARFIFEALDADEEFETFFRLVAGKSEEIKKLINVTLGLIDPLLGLSESEEPNQWQNIFYGVDDTDFLDNSELSLALKLSFSSEGQNRAIFTPGNGWLANEWYSRVNQQQVPLNERSFANFPIQSPIPWLGSSIFPHYTDVWRVSRAGVRTEFHKFGVSSETDLLKLWDQVFEDSLYYFLNNLNNLSILSVDGLPEVKSGSVYALRPLLQAASPSDWGLITRAMDRQTMSSVRRFSNAVLCFGFITWLKEGGTKTFFCHVLIAAMLGNTYAHVIIFQNHQLVQDHFKNHEILFLKNHVVPASDYINTSLFGYIYGIKNIFVVREKVAADIRLLVSLIFTVE